MKLSYDTQLSRLQDGLYAILSLITLFAAAILAVVSGIWPLAFLALIIPAVVLKPLYRKIAGVVINVHIVGDEIQYENQKGERGLLDRQDIASVDGPSGPFTHTAPYFLTVHLHDGRSIKFGVKVGKESLLSKSFPTVDSFRSWMLEKRSGSFDQGRFTPPAL